MTRDERIFRRGFDMGAKVTWAVLAVAIRDAAAPSKQHADSAWAACRGSLPPTPRKGRTV